MPAATRVVDVRLECGEDAEDPVLYKPLKDPVFRKGINFYNAATLATWMSMPDPNEGCKNHDPMTREAFTLAERKAIFEAAGMPDMRTCRLFMDVAGLATEDEVRSRLGTLDADTRRAVVCYAVPPSKLTLLMHAAVELMPEFCRVLLSECSDAAYVNATDSSGHTAFSALFYWNVEHDYSWGPAAEVVAHTLLWVDGIDTSAVVAVLRAVRARGKSASVEVAARWLRKIAAMRWCVCLGATRG